MKEFDNGTLLVERIDELPNLSGSNLFLDFETTSKNSKKHSKNPWHHCWILGFGIAVDDSPVYYVPVRDKDIRFSPWDWLNNILLSTKQWINHNIKYDAHVYFNEVDVDSRQLPTLIDTITFAKLVDSDRRYTPGGYTLTGLSRDWLEEDISHYEKALQPYLKTEKGVTFNQDYGEIPLHLIAPYAGQDIITNRKLYRYIRNRVPEESYDIAKIEVGVTQALFEMERTGVRVRPNQLKMTQAETLLELIGLQRELEEKVSFPFNPASPKDIYDVLINTYGLPVLERTAKTDKGGGDNAKFSKEVLEEYCILPEVIEKGCLDVVEGIAKFRRLDLFLSMFVKRYQELAVEDNKGLWYLHPDFNQTVATGRMSCSTPNAQQLNYEAKKLIVPPPGYSFISIDYSQIEFRLIVHLIQNQDAIAGYAKDKDMDFHNWAKDILPGNVDRDRAKITNFSISYGKGVKGLSQTLPLMKDLQSQAINREHFKSLCRIRAKEIYDQYHGTFPEIKDVAGRLASEAKRNGFITNLYGRRRHLPSTHYHTAFNSWCQSTAADIMKDRLVAVSEWCKQERPEIKPVLCVHDDIDFIAPTEIAYDMDTIRSLVQIMETPSRLHMLDVPLRCSVGRSKKSWAGCKEEEFSVEWECV